MTVTEIEEEIRKYRVTRQVQYEQLMECLHDINNCISEITTCDEVIEQLLRKEIEELRRQVQLAKREGVI